MTRLGDQLKAARERRGAGLDQVSETTRIRTHYLEALERHDWQALPADVFTRGYIRTYAQYLGLDQEHLLKAYARERRLAGIDGPFPSEQDQHEAARAFLEKLVATQGVRARRLGTTLKLIVLGLTTCGLGALTVWTYPYLPWPVWGDSTAMKAPPRAEQRAATSPAASQPLAVASIAMPLPAPPLERRAPAEPSSAGHLQVAKFGVGTGIAAHELVGQGDRFREGTAVWFWTSVLGGRPGDKIQHVWLHDGRSIDVAELAVSGAPWRTQSRRWLPKGSAGEWTVEARDPEGRVMATVGFACVP